MTTIVSALSRIARQCSVREPSSWVTATRDDQVELRDDFMAETIDDILSRIDLPSPIGKQTTVTGGLAPAQADGSERFSLPSDFLRLQRDELAVYDNLLDTRCVPITSDGSWKYLTDAGLAGAMKYYRTQGYDGNWTIDLYRMSGGDITISYVSKNWMADSGGTAGDTLTADTDVLLLPRRLVEAGTVWRFRERRGLPYEGKHVEYEALVARLSNDYRGRRVVSFGGPGPKVKWTDLVPASLIKS